jgi:hypothetical protein
MMCNPEAGKIANIQITDVCITSYIYIYTHLYIYTLFPLSFHSQYPNY